MNANYVDNFPLTNIGNAKRFIARHGDDVRFCPSLGKWLIWTGKQWKPDCTLEATSRAKETVSAMLRHARKEEYELKKQLEALPENSGN